MRDSGRVPGDHRSMAAGVPEVVPPADPGRELAVPFYFRRSEWGHHLNFRDPDNIAVELVLLRPDAEVRAVLDRSSPET